MLLKYLLDRKLSQHKARLLDNETVFQVVDPFHLDGAVLGDIPADVNANLAGFTTVDGNIGGLVLFAVVDTVGLWTERGTEVARGLRTYIFVDLSNVIHGLSSKKV